MLWKDGNLDEFEKFNCVYLIHVADTYYKFGISRNIQKRIHAHNKYFCGMGHTPVIIKVWKCYTEQIMKDAENKIKMDANRIQLYGLTEILNAADISVIVNSIDNDIQMRNNVAEIQEIDAKNINVNEQAIDQNKARTCELCGKSFGKQIDIDRHRQRKTPCIITVVSEENKHNPNRCIFCNKTFVQKQGLVRHQKTCKVKNEVIRPQDPIAICKNEIILLKDVQQQKDLKMDEMKTKLTKLEAELAEIKRQLQNKTK